MIIFKNTLGISCNQHMENKSNIDRNIAFSKVVKTLESCESLQHINITMDWFRNLRDVVEINFTMNQTDLIFERFFKKLDEFSKKRLEVIDEINNKIISTTQIINNLKPPKKQINIETNNSEFKF